MNFNFNNDKPIYIQIADEIEDAIFTGAFEEETQIPSTTEISTTFKINPATVLKGINILVDNNLIYKKRGVGMFVQKGAIKKIKNNRQEQFYKNYVETLVKEANKIGCSKKDLLELIERGFNE